MTGVQTCALPISFCNAGCGVKHRTRPGVLLVQRLTATVFNIGLPRSANLFNHAIRQAGVIQIICLFSPGFIRPVEELQHFCALLWFLLIFVDQNERGRGNRPRIFAFLVGQILSECFAPVCAFCRIGKVFFGRRNRFTISGDQFGVRQVVLLSVSIFNITNRTRQTLNERGDTVVTFTTRPIGHFTVEPVPTLFFHSSFTFAR